MASMLFARYILNVNIVLREERNGKIDSGCQVQHDHLSRQKVQLLIGSDVTSVVSSLFRRSREAFDSRLSFFLLFCTDSIDSIRFFSKIMHLL